MLFKKLLVALDYSEASQCALKFAADLAKETGAEIICLHVIDARFTTPPPAYLSHSVGEVNDQLRESALSRLKEIGEDSAPGLEITYIVEVGVPGEGILAAAEQHQVDLLVLGTHGRTGLRRALLGSQAEAVVRRSHIPVMVVPCPADSSEEE